MARRRSRSSARWFLAVMAIAILAVCYWLGWPLGRSGEVPPDRLDGQVALTNDRPEVESPDTETLADVPERGASPDPTPADQRVDPQRARALLTSGRTALQRGELVTARALLSEALAADLATPERVQLKAELARLSEQTLFSKRILPDDPHVTAHLVASGETLGKIARHYSVTDDLLAKINGIANKNQIRVGQRLKVLQGPFRVEVSKADYRMDVFLGSTLVKQYPVGLGEDDSTPRGGWKVKNKLKNPQYYPPRGGAIIMADDPQNPLGERWIGLEGIEGEAVGQRRYGIHGTVEAESIGKSISLGCIRMYNADVEELFDLLVEGKSEVIVR